MFAYIFTACSPINNVEFLGNPIKTNPIILDITMSKNSEGKENLFFCTYMASREYGSYLYSIDPYTGNLKQLYNIPNRYGPYHIDTSPDGTVYMGVYGTGYSELWSYDPISNSLNDLGPAIPNEDFTFGLTGTPWGKIYGGTHGSGKIFEFDPVTQSFRDLGILVEENKYPKAFLPLHDQKLLIGTGSPAHLVLLDLKNNTKKTDLLPEEFRNISFSYNLWQSRDHIFLRTAPEEHMLIYDKITLEYLYNLPNPAFNAITDYSDNHIIYLKKNGYMVIYDVKQRMSLDSLKVPDSVNSPRMYKIMINNEPWFTGVNPDGVWWRFNVMSGEVIYKQLKLPMVSTNITALAKGPDNKIYGGTYETNALFSYDPDSNKTIQFGNVAPGRTGEILAMATLNDKLYTLSYIQAVLCEYDPLKPWKPGKSAESNPREIGEIGAEQNRPFDMIPGPDNRLYMATFAEYGKTKGALTRYDPEKNEFKNFRGLADEQNLFSLTFISDSIIAIGTSCQIEGRERLSESAKVLLFNIYSEKVINEIVLCESAITIQSLVYLNNILLGVADGVLFKYEIQTQKIKLWKDYELNSLLISEYNKVYAIGNNSIFRLDFNTNKLKRILTVGGTMYRTSVITKDEKLFFSKNKSLMMFNAK